MRTVMLATHGHMASGIKSALEIIAGSTDNVISIDAFTPDCPNPEEVIGDLLERFSDDELIVLTDVYFGGVNQIFLKHLKSRRFPCITGISLPLAVEVLIAVQNEGDLSSLSSSIELCRSEMKFVESPKGVKERGTEDEAEEL